MITKGLIAAIILGIIPELLGLLVLHFCEKEKYNILLALPVGYLIEFGIIEIVTVISIYKHLSLTFIIDVVSKISIVLAIISIIINLKNILGILKQMWKEIKETPKMLAIIAIALIVFQLYFPLKYMHIDDDDSYYVAAAETAVYTDRVLKIDHYTGAETKTFYVKYALAPFLIIYAIIGKIINLYTATVAHTVLPAIFIPLVYIVYYQIGKELFDDIKKRWLFLIFMSVLHIFGNYSIRNNFTFLLFRIWQGKSMLANFILPLAILFLLKADKNNHKLIYYILLLITSIGATLTTTMAIGFIPITIMSLSFSIEIANFNIKNLKRFFLNLIKAGICCIPCLANGVAYILLK